MTREEAIEVIKAYRDKLTHSVSNQLDGDIEAFNMAIEALKQEPCDDAISRQAVVGYLCTHCPDDAECFNDCDDIKNIKALPSINSQEPKTEKVIKMRDATPEERESIEKYVKSISKLTGVNFWDLEQEPETGRWKRIGYDIYECSICGQDVMTSDICAYRHCHCCGTKMKSEVTE